uniref:Phosphoglycolate phosphatase n=1 Tax=Glycine max TaxID=3847 RepID=I1L678_SOYBN
MLRSSTLTQSVTVTCVRHSHRQWFQSIPVNYRFFDAARNSLSSPNSAIFKWKRKANYNRHSSGMGTFTTRALAQPLQNADELIDSVETFIFDCDGVIWKGDKLIDGVPETLDMLRSKGKRLVFVTNNSTKSRKQYGKKFETLGLNVSEEEIFASSFAAAAYLKSIDFPKDKKVYVIGEDGILKELELAGYQYLGGPEDGGKKIELKPGFLMEHDEDLLLGLIATSTTIKSSMGHSVYVKTLDVFSLLQTEMLLLISQMLKNGQVGAQWLALSVDLLNVSH